MCEETDGIKSKILIPIKIGTTQWYISADRHNWILGKKTKGNVNKAGKLIPNYTGQPSFFNSLEGLMSYVQTLKLKSEVSNSLDDLQRNIIKTKEEIKNLYASLTEEELTG